ncbi:hypothetical protein [Luteipulveratus mongoliensis]|uniref:ATP/GTP-binding protein n=1 Tax=Luteipulveratus mongoliensis TaxID=571913 RepID=A0A0K1JMV6_9MICO|nr:hypothetical protein [Luteipulveratus mongoliensis]AKU18052.1 hypothetical protein VV02_22950 [Luteipulveratus mongoliensis]
MTVALVGVLSAAGTTSAAAFDGPTPGPGVAHKSAKDQARLAASQAGLFGGTVQRSIGSCNVISGPSYLGVDCGSVSGGGTITIKGLLGPDPLPGCWDTEMGPDEQEAMGVQSVAGPGGYTWYWHKCLKGIDPKTLKVKPEGVSFTYGVVVFPNTPKKGDPRPTILTIRQKRLVDSQEKRGVIPSPVAGLSPDATPVVNQAAAFFDGTDGEVAVDAGPISLRARVDKITVRPQGTAESISCPGTGIQVTAADTRATKPNACWYEYENSSHGQPDNRYQAGITAHWNVEYSTNGGSTWSPLNNFTKQATTTVQVNEIQSLVVR